MTDFHPPVTEAPVWAAQRARLLGALIEKAMATPQNYPLSLNALVAACNQTTNRDPITEFTESQVEALLDEAKTDRVARFVHPRSGRGVTKYKHVVDEALGLEPKELALVGVLLLRGPQTVSELRTRTERLAPFGGNDDVEHTLDAMATRQPFALVERLGREPGHRERRWVQLLCPAQGHDRTSSGVASSEPQPAVPAEHSANPAAAPANPAAAPAKPAELAEPTELAMLRAEVTELRAELAEVRSEFEAFRAEFS